MKITLVRHTEVQEKYIGCYNGHKDIGLSAKGYEDARKFIFPDFDAIFCSDLIRTRETLKQFIDLDKAKTTLPMGIVYTKELREKSWGKHEGLSFDEIIAQGEVKYVDFQQWIDDLDGESVQSYTCRVQKFLFEYILSLDSENILIVTHSGVIKTFIAYVKKLSLEEAFSYKIPYGSFVKYDFKSEILKINEISL